MAAWAASTADITALLSGSLALLSDAGHMLSDVGAIGGALWAISLAARPPSGKWTYGWKRAEILSAAANGITLLVAAWTVTSGLPILSARIVTEDDRFNDGHAPRLFSFP